MYQANGGRAPVVLEVAEHASTKCVDVRMVKHALLVNSWALSLDVKALPALPSASPWM